MGTPTAPSPLLPLVERLESAEALDPAGEKVAKTVRDLIGPGVVKDALAGTWLGHALHPVLTDVPIGTWTSALVLDWLGGDDGEAGADRLIAVGLAASVPTFWSGWVDWADSTAGNPAVKRVGIVHALANGGGAALMAASLAARGRGARGRGKLLALAAGGFMGAGAFLGGHLSFAEGIGVNQTAFESAPEDWADVLGEAELTVGTPRCVRVDGIAVLVVRDGGEVRAISDRCSHRGGALHEGEVADGCVTCPLHGSMFDLRDGSVRGGPAPYPQPVWETRVRGGRIEVRAAA
jgi:nitrite reductase/ring-hydroxylating ferredoxin subunit